MKTLKKWLGIEGVEAAGAQYESLLKVARLDSERFQKANVELRMENIELRNEVREKYAEKRTLHVAEAQEDIIHEVRAHIQGIHNMAAGLRNEIANFEKLIAQFNSSLITTKRFPIKKRQRKQKK